MFLGGRERSFTDDFPAEQTDVGLHGHYGRDGRLLVQLVRDLGLKAWIVKYADGKADERLVERWINIPRNTGMIHFFHPERVRRDGFSTFMCQGDEKSEKGVFGCEPIDRTALDLGIATSLALVHSNDQPAIRTDRNIRAAPNPSPPPGTARSPPS
jgi:hypothetical protein